MAERGALTGTVERLARTGPDLTITADLSVTVDGIDITVSTVEDRIHVQLPSVRASIRLLRRDHGRLPRLSRILAESGVTAELRVGSAVIAVAGSAATPGRLSDVLSLGAVEVRLPTLVLSALGLR